MIKKDFTENRGNSSYRDITGYHFGKWFDEPFTIDVLNRTKYQGLTFEACSQEDDFQHRDYKFIGVDNKLYYVDSKTHAHNYSYKRGDKEMYTDMLPIGEYALASQFTDYISFVHRGFIHIVPLSSLNYTIKPLKVRESLGQNKSTQILYMFDCYDIIADSNTQHIKIPDEMMKCYDDAYELYTEYKKLIKKITNKRIGINLELAKQYMKEFAQRLEPIIDRFNNIYDELPEVDIQENLSDILDLLD